MHGFGLILGHLIGDYILQNDWMAKNKTNPSPGARPKVGENAGWAKWHFDNAHYLDGHYACTLHCLLYTFAVWLCSFWWLPFWAYLIIFLTHWPVDRFRLARKWMALVGQEAFATGPMSPWSIIIVDNTIHLTVLFLLGVCV